MDLEPIRKKIDQIDVQLVDLLNQRLVLAATMPNETIAAQATWIDGIAANWSEIPVLGSAL